jgi:methylated-DNA-[protein]-cysteine S-methyltransferase
MIYNIYATPLGKITIASNGTHITELHIEDDKYFLVIPNDWQKVSDHPLLEKAHTELMEFFAKKRTVFGIPLSPKGTAFQKLVWKALLDIPSGTTVSYMDIAKRINKPAAIRAVGSAIGKNPLCIFIPCHRVMGSDGKFHGYVAGVERKKFLLELEGCIVRNDPHPKQLRLDA